MAFRGSVLDDDYTKLIFDTAKLFVKEDERFIQAAVGWVMSDMSKVKGRPVSKFFKDHVKGIDMEFFTRHTKYLKDRDRFIDLKKSQAKS